MHLFVLTAFLTLIPALAVCSLASISDTAIAPHSLGNTGSYAVSGLGSRKKHLVACGANKLDLAIAMIEYTERMSTDHTYGGGKTSDSANFGVFKQNWGMLRQSVSRYSGKNSDYNTGSELNSSLWLDINLRRESQNHFGEGLWFAGHRNGASGLANPNTKDIQNYEDAVYLYYYNNGADMTSDVRF